MPTPDDRRYSKEHEWLKIDGDTATVGITDYAQKELGDIVYVDLPEPGVTLSQFAKMGEIESVKVVSELFSPASGEVVEVNEALVEKPELVNSEPYGAGWLLRLRLSSPGEYEALLSSAAYGEHVQGLR
jgi:glycine cleavage system H protein